ncbi:MAG: hypothetical protein ACI9DK_001203 [Vicingaceae bacterium]|jgi:hypothetical protein
MNKIDAIIIGAQKAGTTSLKNYLGKHKNINTHLVIEYPYFKDDSEFNKGYDKSLKKYFDDTSPQDILLAKNIGMYYDETALRRLKEHNPECKLILSLREPLSRTISSYKMEVFNGGINYKFQDIIESVKNKEYDSILYKIFIEQSLYINHIDKIYKYFPKNQVRFIDFRELIKDPQSECNRVAKWLGLEESLKINKEEIHNKTKAPKSAVYSNILKALRSKDSKLKKLLKKILPYRVFTKFGMLLLELNKSDKQLSNINSADIIFLNKYFNPYNKKLKDHTGIDFDKV